MGSFLKMVLISLLGGRPMFSNLLEKIIFLCTVLSDFVSNQKPVSVTSLIVTKRQENDEKRLKKDKTTRIRWYPLALLRWILMSLKSISEKKVKKKDTYNLVPKL